MVLMYVLCIVCNFINGQDNILFSMVAISMSLILTGTSYSLSILYIKINNPIYDVWWMCMFSFSAYCSS